MHGFHCNPEYQYDRIGLKSILLTQQKALEQRISSVNDHEKSNPSNIGQNMSIKRDMTIKRKATDCELGLNLTLELASITMSIKHAARRGNQLPVIVPYFIIFKV